MLLKDLWRMGVAFDLKRSLLDAPSPAHSALIGYLTRHRLGAFTCIDESGRGKPQACVQTWADGDRLTWSLGFVSPSLDGSSTVADGWRRLLGHLIVSGAQRGIERIAVGSAEDAAVEDLLREIGFRVAGREEVFVLRNEPGEAGPPRRSQSA